VSAAAVRVLSLLHEHRQTLATAESLTGGLIAELLTDVPGASRSYVGGLVTYATRLKSALAGVEQGTLDRLGPVAGLTAQQMATGVATRCEADWGLSATGVAGPDEQDGHPVGQVYVGVAQPRQGYHHVLELRLTGSRQEIRRQAADRALELLTEVLGMQRPADRVDEKESPRRGP
jgi:nicotinamide-nucleotide amidase